MFQPILVSRIQGGFRFDSRLHFCLEAGNKPCASKCIQNLEKCSGASHEEDLLEKARPRRSMT